ncbi:DUF6976 family protein [Maridesulfovibrio zosterae]|uniref:DUF6976 family protein n=1 Tax=Maridesulfovibrio zosterae TaxID=82171 RepID=UPI00040384B6|nr:hypothetical protein [Maridesulfovibrio zosterae]
MQQELFSLNDVKTQIADGKTLLIAGDEKLLKELPKGQWIGGSIPYFISPGGGGLVSHDKVFVTDISELTKSVSLKVYDQNGLGSVYSDAGNSGFSFIVIPASSPAHVAFALNAPNYKDFGSQPLVGWISGVHLDDLGKIAPKVFNGETGEVYENEAVVMHVELIAGKTVDVGIINSFEQGDGDNLTFASDGFSCSDVMVNGVKENFADYILKNKLDTKLPLVADYYGALINTSFQSVDPGGEVHFYAPVFTGVRYKIAKPFADYAAEFSKQLKENNVEGQTVTFSCNCILNYLYSELEGKKTDPFVGPITFGEIAYQLLNQTLVYLTVHDI